MPLTWADPLDPAELLDFSIDWSAEMTAVSDTIAISVWSLDAAAIAAGVEIDSQSESTTVSTVWLKVAPGNQADAGFSDPGAFYWATNKITTAGGRTYERSVKFNVMQL